MRPPLLLVVDDDQDLRDLMQELLTAYGSEVITAANGQDALHQLSQREPDLILLDMKMPIMDGWEFCRALDQRGPHPPVVVMTAAQNPAERASSVRAAGWLGK